MLKGLSILAAIAAWFGRCGDGSVISDATGVDTAPTHLASKLCDPLRSEWAYLSLDAEEATPLRLPTARVAPGGDPTEPAVYDAPMRQAEEAMRRGLVQVGCARRVSAHSTLMVWTDETTVRLTYLDPSVYVLFLQRDAFEVRTLPTPTDAFFYAPAPDQWKTYACEGKDVLTVELTTNAVTPRQVSTDASHIVFVDVAAAGSPWDVFAYARTASHPLRWTEVEVKAEALTPLPGAAALHRLHPVVCGGRLMYLEVRTAGGGGGGGEETVLQSTVISVDLESGETVRHGSGSSSLMYALTAWPVSHSSHECAFAWAEAAGNATKLVLRTAAAEAWEAPHLALNVSAAEAVAASSAAAGAPVVGGAPSLFASHVVVETFPDRALRRLLVAADSAAAPATELVQTLAGGGPYLFVKKAEVEKISAYKIEDIEGYSYDASAGAATTTRTTGSGVSVSNDAALETVAVDVHSKTRELEGHRLLLRLHSSMDAAVVYQLAYLRTDARAEPAAVNFPALFLSRLHVERAHRSELPEKLQRYTCVFPRAYDPEFTAAYHDLVVTRIRGEAVLSRVDLDKDNDGLHDRQDRFPLHSKLTWDSDNDGHADEDDIVGWIPCDDSPVDEVNTCASDLTVMYSIWAIFTFVLIVISMSLGWYRSKLLREGIVVESLLDEEDLVLLGEEGSEGESEGGWFRDLRLLYTIRDRMSLFQAAETVVQHFLLLLTLASVVLVIIPVWNKTHMRGSTLSVFEWVDLFTASVFAIDLIFRWVFREDPSMTFLQFFRENWFDFPSLVCDLPGATNSPTLNALVAVRLLRMLRVLKVFRVMRFYRKLTNQSAYVSLVVNHSQWLIPIIAVLLLVTVAMVLKIVEQQDQSEFESYWNCLWFCFVTATTVGYGDMTPIHWVGRVLACVLMFCGIGMIGNVTARVSEKISQTGYQRAQEKERKERHEEHPAIRLALLEISVAFNPLVALRDKRKEPVDPLSLKYMTPRYRDVAVMQSNERILRDLETPADSPVAGGHVDLESRGRTSGGGGGGGSVVLKSEVVSTRSASVAESGSSFASSSSNPGIAEVRVLWKGKGHYGGIVKLAFLRAAALERLGGGLHTVYVPPKELAKALREDGDIKRLQRMVTTVELSALNETIQVLEQAKYQTKIITWELFEKELIQTQEYHYAVARDMLLKRQQLEGNWTRFNDKHMVQKLKRFRDQRDDPIPKCRDKLYLLLLRYKLDETYKGVRDFDKLYMRLNSLIFRRPKKNQLIIEKVFSVGCFEEGVGEQEDDPEELENMYDWQDPLEDVFEEIEVVLRQHNVHAVEGFVEILFAIESIAMQFDRLECTRWALHHLEWGRADRVVIVPRPPLATDKGTTNIINPLLHIPKPQRCPHSDLQGECREYLVYTMPAAGAAAAGARGRPNTSGPTSPAGDADTDADSDKEDGFHAMGETVAVLPADCGSGGGLSLARSAPVATSLGNLRRLSDQRPVCHGHRCTTQRHLLGVAVAGGSGSGSGSGGGGDGDADVTKDPRGHFVCPNGHLHLCVDCVREPKRGGGVGGTLGEGGDATASRTWRSNASQQSSATATTGGGGSRRGSVGPRRYSCRFDEAETMRLDVINRSSSYRRREGEGEAVGKKPSADYPTVDIQEVVSSSDSAASYQGGLGKREPTMEELDPPSSDEVSDTLSALQGSMLDADGNPLAPPPPREKRRKVKKTSGELEVDPACLI